MHLSMHNWMRAEPPEVTLRRLAKYGYESIEISGEPEQYDTKELRRLLQETGMRCWGAVTLMLGETILEEPKISVDGEKLVVEGEFTIPQDNVLSIVIEGAE